MPVVTQLKKSINPQIEEAATREFFFLNGTINLLLKLLPLNFLLIDQLLQLLFKKTKHLWFGEVNLSCFRVIFLQMLG